MEHQRRRPGQEEHAGLLACCSFANSVHMTATDEQDPAYRGFRGYGEAQSHLPAAAECVLASAMLARC